MSSCKNNRIDPRAPPIASEDAASLVLSQINTVIFVLLKLQSLSSLPCYSKTLALDVGVIILPCCGADGVGTCGEVVC